MTWIFYVRLAREGIVLDKRRQTKLLYYVSGRAHYSERR